MKLLNGYLLSGYGPRAGGKKQARGPAPFIESRTDINRHTIHIHARTTRKI
jgi:hypothetical protein